MREFLDTHAALVTRLAREAAREAQGGLEASDVTHESFVTLLRMYAHGSFDPNRIENPEAYLRIVVRNAATRAFTRSHRGDELGPYSENGGRPDAESSPDDIAQHAHDARRALDTVKSKLSPRDAVAFALRVEDGLSVEEIATTLPGGWETARAAIAKDGGDDPSRYEELAATSTPSIPIGSHLADEQLARLAGSGAAQGPFAHLARAPPAARA